MWNTDILTGSSFHSKEAPVLAFRPQPGAQSPPAPPTSCRPCTWGRTSPGRDALRLVKSTRLLSLPLALGRVLFQTSQGFHSTNNCMRAEGRLKRTCVCGGFISFHHFAGLIPSLPGAFRWISFYIEEGSLLLLLTLSIFMVSACLE